MSKIAKIFSKTPCWFIVLKMEMIGDFTHLSDAYPGRWMCYSESLLTLQNRDISSCVEDISLFSFGSLPLFSQNCLQLKQIWKCKLQKSTSALPVRWLEMQESRWELFLDESLPQGNNSKDHPLLSTVSRLSRKRKQALIEEPWIKSSVSHFHLCYD